MKTSSDQYIKSLQESLYALNRICELHVEGYEGCTERWDATRQLEKAKPRKKRRNVRLDRFHQEATR